LDVLGSELLEAHITDRGGNVQADEPGVAFVRAGPGREPRRVLEPGREEFGHSLLFASDCESLGLVGACCEQLLLNLGSRAAVEAPAFAAPVVIRPRLMVAHQRPSAR
jgi:hypothetical protein